MERSITVLYKLGVETFVNFSRTWFCCLDGRWSYPKSIMFSSGQLTKMHNEQELQEGNSGSIERERLTSLMVNTSLYSLC